MHIYQHECPECGEAAIRLCSGILVCDNCEAGFGPPEQEETGLWYILMRKERGEDDE